MIGVGTISSRILSIGYSNSNSNSNYQSSSSSSSSCFPTKPFLTTPRLQGRFLSSFTVGGVLSSPVMASEERNEVFDMEAARLLVNDLRDVFNSGKTHNFDWRISQLKALHKLIQDNENAIMESLYSDLSKPQHEVFMSEITLTKSSCELMIKELKHWMRPEKAKTTMTTYPSTAEIVSEPLGVVLVISTWNYPFMLSLVPVIGAIAAGNAVVLKPSEIAPATSELLAKLLGAYLDQSAIKVVEGAVAETTALLEQKWDLIFYTGNARIGRIIMAAAAKHLTPVILELGGKSPTIVDSNVDLQVAARRIIAGKWGCNNGQACIAPDYVITTKAFAPELIDALQTELISFFGEKPMESKDLSRIINLNHFTRLAKLMDEDKVFDKIVVGGQRNEKQLKIAPTILLDVPENSLIMKDEIFGPLLPIVTVQSLEDSFAVINSGSKPLAAYCFTNNDKLKKEFIRKISAGGVVINDTTLHTALDTLPFGGVGESGMGSYHGKFSFDAFSHKKAVLYRSFKGDSAIRYPPYTPRKLRLLRALIGGRIFELILILVGWYKD